MEEAGLTGAPWSQRTWDSIPYWYFIRTSEGAEGVEQPVPQGSVLSLHLGQ